MSLPEEPEWQRLARNVAELLQELRVAQAGVQILFGFLLAVAFTDRYAAAGVFIHTLHLIAVLLAVLASALFTAPAAWHRLLFRLRQREHIVRTGNWMALGGLASLAGALTATVLLLVDAILGGLWATVVGVLVGTTFLVLWFVLPMRLRLKAGRE